MGGYLPVSVLFWVWILNDEVINLSIFVFFSLSGLFFSLQTHFLLMFFPKLKESDSFQQGAFWDSFMNEPFDKQEEGSFEVSG